MSIEVAEAEAKVAEAVMSEHIILVHDDKYLNV